MEVDASAELTTISSYGSPWGSSGKQSTLSMQGTQVPFLLRELRSHVPRGS